MRFLILIFTFSILFSCQEKSKKVHSKLKSKTETEVIQPEKRKDTIYNYWELDLEVSVDKKEFEISNKTYMLELKTYSLNDSSIVRVFEEWNSKVYIDHSHKIVTDLKLLTDSIVYQKQIDRRDFKKSLIPEFYEVCNLFSTEIDSIVENTVYLTSDLAVPDTDNQWYVWYSIKIVNNQFEKLEITKTDYVGL